MIFDFLFLKRKKVFALVGGSGTGKSFHAKIVAQKYRVDFMIDDGLLIKDNRILAGHSAKKEHSFMAAVKVALFDDKTHRDEVARKLQTEKFKRILLLGTSEKMVHKIAARLQLDAPFKIIKIEDIASQEEIDKAIRTRRIEGKHVIPVPSMEIKKNYPNIFYDAIKIFKRRMAPGKPMTANRIPADSAGVPSGIGPLPTLHEKSLVRPEYSKHGRVFISEGALIQFVTHCVDEYETNIKIKKILVKNTEMGYRLVITIDVPYGIQLGGNIQDLQQYVIDNIERYTGILIEEVNIIIDKITE
ncbi:MAG: alkaline shock response membrane anchor protein AmaP [Treponema sp.]|nr:alkaline shock response membrane anchor protein AmaP [Treponema sp.]